MPPTDDTGLVPDRPPAPGAALTLNAVIWKSSAADATASVAGVSLHVPPGQSVAVHSEPPGDARELLDVIAGLRAPRSGQVSIDGLSVDQPSGAAQDRYLASRTVLSTRFPLRPELSAIDNVLAEAPADGMTIEQAAELLALTGAAQLTGPAGDLPAEQQWRILVARALRPRPRLVLAEDPTPGLDSRRADLMLDLLTDMHAQFGFTLLLAVGHLATASRCQRLVRLAGGDVVDDELIGDDPGIRGRVDRIG